MKALIDQERLQLEQAIFAKLPKAVHTLSCDIGAFIKQNNVSSHNITTIACKSIMQSDPEIQSLVQNFNARHPTQPYTLDNLDNFGSTPAASQPQQQAIITSFQHNKEQNMNSARKANTSSTPVLEEANESAPKIKPK